MNYSFQNDAKLLRLTANMRFHFASPKIGLRPTSHIRRTLYEKYDMNNDNRILRSLSRILLVALLLQGCTSHHAYRPNGSKSVVPEINQKSKSMKTKVELKDGDLFLAKNLHFQPDTTFWYTSDGTQRIEYPTTNINKVTLYDRPRGALDGFIAGAIPGFILGSVAGYAHGSPSSPYDDELTLGDVLLGGVGGAAILGLLGIPLGWISGHKDVYTISGPMSGNGE